MKQRKHPLYIKIPDDKGNLVRVLKLHKFNDTNRAYFIEPQFMLIDDKITRKDNIFEAIDIVGEKGCGFIPSNLKEFRDYCRTEYHKFKNDEIFINPTAIYYGMEEPPYNDKVVTSTKYHL